MKPSPSSADPEQVTLRLPARPESLEPLRDFIMDRAQAVSDDVRFLSRIDLIQEELLVNVVSYAYAGSDDGEVAVTCTGRASESLTIDIVDQGRPFNPLTQPGPDTEENINERPVGGLGILLSRRMADHIKYVREDDSNRVSVTIRP
ncbi:MAG: ATP-binding protein [Deltaproteobacteria bacterium]|nr:ATP-binding protein [Deltaproteobacteria bacterium]